MRIRPFEIALIATFAIAAIGGLIFLSMYKGSDDAEAKLYGDTVEVWGTFSKNEMRDFLFEAVKVNKALEAVTYREVDERTFDEELLNAIAEGNSPDLVMLPHSLLVTYRTKLQVISYETLPERTFRDSYVDGASIFMRSDGTYGIPFAVDPLVLYWNRDIFSSSGVTTPPRTWEALVNETVGAATRIDVNQSITQSAVALGEYANVTHAKDILATLLFQAGNDIVTEDGDSYAVTLVKRSDRGTNAVDAALNFYIQFALPHSDAYTWNRSRELDKTEFLRGTLALYFGKASEERELERANPNLNFDVAPIPQAGSATVHRSYGDFYAFAIPRASKNIGGAFGVAMYLTGPEMDKALASAVGLAPANRSLLGARSDDPFWEVVRQAALISRGWLDPSPNESGDIFRTLVESSLIGDGRTGRYIVDAAEELESLFR